MRRTLEFLHTIGAIGLMGAVACELVLAGVAPPPTAVAGYAAVRSAMGAIATWIFLPALGLTLVAGLFAMALTNAYQNAGWAWVKLATGVLIFEGFVHVQGDMQAEAGRSVAALAGHIDPATLGGSLGAERITLWLVLAVATANVALGIWRPRLTRSPKSS